MDNSSQIGTSQNGFKALDFAMSVLWLQIVTLWFST